MTLAQMYPITTALSGAIGGGIVGIGYVLNKDPESRPPTLKKLALPTISTALLGTITSLAVNALTAITALNINFAAMAATFAYTFYFYGSWGPNGPEAQFHFEDKVVALGMTLFMSTGLGFITPILLFRPPLLA